MKPNARFVRPHVGLGSALGLLCAALLAACAGPRAPDWQMSAHDALERMGAAYLSGNDRVASAEFAQARAELARTGDASLVARAELNRCALRLASLVLEPCAGFAPLAADASPAERAYARYLAGEPVDEPGLLPAAQQAALAGGSAAILQIADPLARLVASGAAMRRGQADPALIAQAVDTASAQAWRRPLLAWLGVQLRRAELANQPDEVQRLRRRMALVAGEGGR